MKGKKGMLPALGVMILIMLAGVALWQGGKYVVDNMLGDGGDTLSIEKDGKTEVITDPDKALQQKELSGCDGIASVNALYNDLNAFKAGTDPSNTTTIFMKNGASYVKTVADDATSTTVPVLSSFDALAGNNLGVPLTGYFSEEISFETGCSDVDIQPELYPSGAPTITIVNDDAITKNSDTNHEAMDASSEYFPCMTIRAPSEACSARYGAVVAFEYNSTTVNKIQSSHLTKAQTSFLKAHTGNLDQYEVMQWSGQLCDGDKVEVCFDVETTTTAPGEDTANVVVHWYPINKDLDADTLEPITGIYDEDNNVISTGNTTSTYYTA